MTGAGQCFLTAQLRRAERIGHAVEIPTVVATMSSAGAKCSLLRLNTPGDAASPRIMFALFEDHGADYRAHADAACCALEKIPSVH